MGIKWGNTADGWPSGRREREEETTEKGLFRGDCDERERMEPGLHSLGILGNFHQVSSVTKTLLGPHRSIWRFPG